MDGLALAGAISDRWPPCKLIIVSGRNLPPPEHFPNGALFMANPVPFEAAARPLAAWDLAA